MDVGMSGMLPGVLGSGMRFTAPRENLLDICYNLLEVFVPSFQKCSNNVDGCAYREKREENA